MARAGVFSLRSLRICKQGVPSVFMVPGLKSKDPNVDGKGVWCLSTHYQTGTTLTSHSTGMRQRLSPRLTRKLVGH